MQSRVRECPLVHSPLSGKPVRNRDGHPCTWTWTPFERDYPCTRFAHLGINASFAIGGVLLPSLYITIPAVSKPLNEAAMKNNHTSLSTGMRPRFQLQPDWLINAQGCNSRDISMIQACASHNTITSQHDCAEGTNSRSASSETALQCAACTSRSVACLPGGSCSGTQLNSQLSGGTKLTRGPSKLRGAADSILKRLRSCGLDPSDGCHVSNRTIPGRWTIRRLFRFSQPCSRSIPRMLQQFYPVRGQIVRVTSATERGDHLRFVNITCMLVSRAGSQGLKRLLRHPAWRP